MDSHTAYEALIRHAREAALIHSCADLLEWDEETYMPADGAAHRGEQRALLAGLLHERTTAPRVGELLACLEGSPFTTDADSVSAANVREMRRDYERAVRTPRTLVEELARTSARAHQAWLEARQDADYARFRPWLAQLVRLKRDEAECVGYAAEPYDALLDEYEPGATSAELTRLFDALRDALVPLARTIAQASRRARVALLHRTYPVDRQRIFGETVAAAVGFDFARGRLDTSVHPFCTGIGPGDCRFTSRFSVTDFSEGIFSILHEVGHGLYEQGLDPAHFGTPVGEAASVGIHESQSRLWENLVGRSRAFWDHFYPLAREIFHDALHDVSLDDFHLAVNHVMPSLNRVRADEVTYNLHTLVRFELERALIAGDLSADDLPHAWNESYQRYLGLTPPDDTEGCLQDAHWSQALFGYFPTYTLGNVFAAQLFAAARASLGDLDALIRRGEFAALLQWLRAHVHRHGKRWRARELIVRATGSPPDHRPLVDGLWEKYGALYEL